MAPACLLACLDILPATPQHPSSFWLSQRPKLPHIPCWARAGDEPSGDMCAASDNPGVGCDAASGSSSSSSSRGIVCCQASGPPRCAEAACTPAGSHQGRTIPSPLAHAERELERHV